MSVCCEYCVSSGSLQVFASDRSFVQSSPTECGVTECDREASVMRRAWPKGAIAPWGRKIKKYDSYYFHITWQEVR